MAEKEKVVYTKPTSQTDLEARLESEKNGENPFALASSTVNPGTPDETDGLYVGTDPIYQNHANDTEAPLQAQKGGEKLAEEKFLKAYDKPDVNVKNRKAVDEGKPEKQATRRNTALDDRVTDQASPLVAKDPGSGDANTENNEGPDETNEKSSASPTGSGGPSAPSAPQTGQK